MFTPTDLPDPVQVVMGVLQGTLRCVVANCCLNEGGGDFFSAGWSRWRGMNHSVQFDSPARTLNRMSRTSSFLAKQSSSFLSVSATVLAISPSFSGLSVARMSSRRSSSSRSISEPVGLAMFIRFGLHGYERSGITDGFENRNDIPTACLASLSRPTGQDCL